MPYSNEHYIVNKNTRIRVIETLQQKRKFLHTYQNRIFKHIYQLYNDKLQQAYSNNATNFAQIQLKPNAQTNYACIPIKPKLHSYLQTLLSMTQAHEDMHESRDEDYEEVLALIEKGEFAFLTETITFTQTSNTTIESYNCSCCQLDPRASAMTPNDKIIVLYNSQKDILYFCCYDCFQDIIRFIQDNILPYMRIFQQWDVNKPEHHKYYTHWLTNMLSLLYLCAIQHITPRLDQELLVVSEQSWLNVPDIMELIAGKDMIVNMFQYNQNPTVNRIAWEQAMNDSEVIQYIFGPLTSVVSVPEKALFSLEKNKFDVIPSPMGSLFF